MEHTLASYECRRLTYKTWGSGYVNLSSLILPVSVPLRGIAMNRSNTMLFPSVGMHALSAIIHLLGVTILAHLVSRRTILRGNFTLRDASWPWICVLLILIDSWLFIFASGILILGVGLEKNEVSCSMGILLCIIFYGSSKFFIYVFLCSSFHLSDQVSSLNPTQRSEFMSFGGPLLTQDDCNARPILRVL